MILTLAGVPFTVTNFSVRHRLAGDVDPLGFTNLDLESILEIYCTGANFYVMLHDFIVQFECSDSYIFCPGVLERPINYCTGAPDFESARQLPPSPSPPPPPTFTAPTFTSPRLFNLTTLRPQSSGQPKYCRIKPNFDDFDGNRVTSFPQNTSSGSPTPPYTPGSDLSRRLDASSADPESRNTSVGSSESENTVGPLSILNWEPPEYEPERQPLLHRLQSELEPTLLSQIEQNVCACNRMAPYII